MWSSRYWTRAACGLLVAGAVEAAGCYNTPVDVSGASQGPAPLRIPSATGKCDCYEDSLHGGHVFEMYCSYCHNARTLSERPFSSYKNVAAHMRVRANLTGKEYAELMAFLRRYHDIPAPGQDEAPSPKRFIFSQPIAELREQKAQPAPDLPAGPRQGAMIESSPGQPPPGGAPREGR